MTATQDDELDALWHHRPWPLLLHWPQKSWRCAHLTEVKDLPMPSVPAAVGWCPVLLPSRQQPFTLVRVLLVVSVGSRVPARATLQAVAAQTGP